METNQENTNSTYETKGIINDLKVRGTFEFVKKHPITHLSLSDLISLHGWIDYEADLIEASTGDITAKLEKAREQMLLVQQEIERRRGLIFAEG